MKEVVMIALNEFIEKFWFTWKFEKENEKNIYVLCSCFIHHWSMSKCLKMEDKAWRSYSIYVMWISS